MRSNLVLGVLAGACLGPWSAWAQPNFDFSGFAAKAKEKVEVRLDPSTIRLAGEFLSSRNPEEERTKKLLAGIQGVQVNSFEYAEKGAYRPEDLEPLRRQFQGDGWARIVNVKEQNETSEIYVRTESGKTTGLAIISAEPKELTFVYINGTIDLAQVADLPGKFGIPKIPIPDAQKQKGKAK